VETCLRTVNKGLNRHGIHGRVAFETKEFDRVAKHWPRFGQHSDGILCLPSVVDVCYKYAYNSGADEPNACECEQNPTNIL